MDHGFSQATKETSLWNNQFILSPPALLPGKSLEKFSWDVWKFWNGTGMTSLTVNESYTLKKRSRASSAILVWQQDRAPPQSLWNLEALGDTEDDRPLGDTSDSSTYAALSHVSNCILGGEVQSLGCIYSFVTPLFIQQIFITCPLCAWS